MTGVIEGEPDLPDPGCVRTRQNFARELTLLRERSRTVRGGRSRRGRAMTHNGQRTGRKPGNRKPYAWERKLVKSSVPAAEQPAKCKACETETTKGKLRLGYCSNYWSSGT
ncbi:hypothetical protein [Microtetraspora malaysiensis]|uniref:hypothetical protein n=1 Tax=Microtetraspora malaysiensis TaxID=161358 RepID=UPI003D8F2421